jgi:hypothetical protein
MSRFIDPRWLEREVCASVLDASRETRQELREDAVARQQYVLGWLVEHGIVADVEALADHLAMSLGAHRPDGLHGASHVSG